MSEIEIAVVKTHLEVIKGDVSELKDGYKKIAEMLSKLVFLEDKFKANDESHRIIWDKMNKTSDKMDKLNVVADNFKRWQNIKDKLTVALITVGITQILGLIGFIYILLKK